MAICKDSNEYYCPACCVDGCCEGSYPGISDGLVKLRAYSVLNPDVVIPAILEDNVDLSADFAERIIEQ